MPSKCWVGEGTLKKIVVDVRRPVATFEFDKWFVALLVDCAVGGENVTITLAFLLIVAGYEQLERLVRIALDPPSGAQVQHGLLRGSGLRLLFLFLK